MPFTLTMPKLSPTMVEGTIVKWHKSVGEFVEADSLLLEVATDKATVEYNALDAGWLRKIFLNEGSAAIVNQPIAIFTESKEESLEGYKVIDETVSLKESDELALKPNQSLVLSSTLAPISTVAQNRTPTFIPEEPLSNYQFEHSHKSSHSRIKASPMARKLAEKRGIDLSMIKGSGPRGRIISRDLGESEISVIAFGKRSYPDPKIPPGSYINEPLSPIRKVVGLRLQEAKSFIPHFYVSMKIDAEPLIKIREQLKHQDVKVTFNDFIIKATALALRKYPAVNSGFNSSTNTIIRYQTIDISVAVSLPAGLITPIIRHADFKNLGEISLEIKKLASLAKEGKLAPEEYKGGSFTISNLGMYGVSEFIAIINPPQAAILAVSGMDRVAVVRNGNIVPGMEMNLCLSGDHRVIDGVIAAEFLSCLKGILENPAILLI